ncbi:MAG: ATP-binding protein, partial [Gammaproteobacteria bacterium]|nr:ATP-binding protein [Gammaproteobacteria bacterium]
SGAWVLADEKVLKQIIINLLSNAIKYNKPNGYVNIETSHEADNNIKISIYDTGKGLDDMQKLHLFKAFDRAGAEKTDIEGTGIGLVITKDLIQAMNGSIGFLSEPGEGSVFWIKLKKVTL